MTLESGPNNPGPHLRKQQQPVDQHQSWTEPGFVPCRQGALQGELHQEKKKKKIGCF